MPDFPTMYPGAIDVTGNTGGGKPFAGGSGKEKLLIHTIEGAEPWYLGWPRSGSGCPFCTWSSPPHLGLNGWYWNVHGEYSSKPKEPGGKLYKIYDDDWLYQTVPFDEAGKALRANTQEDDRYVWQIEVAGLSASTGDYPDWWYQSLAEVCRWFYDHMGVPNEWGAFERDVRMNATEMNAYSGFLGHRHFGKGIDTHHDPGDNFDWERLRRFAFESTPPPPEEDDEMMWALPYQQADFQPMDPASPNYDSAREERVRFFNEQLQRIVAACYGEIWRGGSTLSVITDAGMTRGVWDDDTVNAIKELEVGSNGTKLGPREWGELIIKAKQMGAWFLT